MRHLLRSARAAFARLASAALAAAPAMEPTFISLGRRAATRSQLLSTVYWAIHADLVGRLRRSGRCFRPLNVQGIDVTLDVTDHTAHLLYFHGEEYEPGVAGAIIGRLRPGDAFLDVGANVGFFSVLAAKVVGPQGKVVAFEPDPTVLARQTALLEANGLSGTVEVVRGAVGERNGQATLHMAADSVLSTLDPPRAPLSATYPYLSTADVTVWSLDEWLARRSDVASRLRLLKIDVEGTEDDAIRGAQRLLTGAGRPAVICETREGTFADRFLQDAGYDRRQLEAHGLGPFRTFLYEPR